MSTRPRLMSTSVVSAVSSQLCNLRVIWITHLKVSSVRVDQSNKSNCEGWSQIIHTLILQQLNQTPCRRFRHPKGEPLVYLQDAQRHLYTDPLQHNFSQPLRSAPKLLLNAESSALMQFINAQKTAEPSRPSPSWTLNAPQCTLTQRWGGSNPADDNKITLKSSFTWHYKYTL